MILNRLVLERFLDFAGVVKDDLDVFTYFFFIKIMIIYKIYPHACLQ